MITLDDVAKEAGVSSSTVSIVVNDRHFRGVSVSQKTRERVLSVAKRMGYTPNGLARAVATGKNRVLGFIKDNFASEVSMRLMTGAQEEADTNDYLIKPFRLTDPDMAIDVIRKCLGQQVAGIILVNLADEAVDIVAREADKAGIPIVSVDSLPSHPSGVHIGSDAEQGASLVCDHLYKLGHRRAGFVGGPAGAPVSEERKTFFLEVCKSRGIEVLDRHVVDTCWGDYVKVNDGVTRLLNSTPGRLPTALFCAGDPIAMMTIKTARQFGLSLPRDLSVVGYSNASFAYLCDPSLTTVSQDFVEMGRAAVRYLLDAEFDKTRSTGCTEIRLPTTLVVRDSTSVPIL